VLKLMDEETAVFMFLVIIRTRKRPTQEAVGNKDEEHNTARRNTHTCALGEPYIKN
jgi:hypothetical protein